MASGNEGVKTVALTFSPGANPTATYTVQTEADDTDEETGTLTVTLLSNSPDDYTVATGTATATVTDDDPPQLRICHTLDGANCAGDPDMSGVAEGDASGNPVRFLIIGTSPVERDVTVALYPAVSPAGLLSETPDSSATLTGGTQTFEFSYMTAPNNDPNTGGGEVRVSLTDPDATSPPTQAEVRAVGYSVASPPDDSALVFILEDDLPELSITGPDTVAEGNVATFTVSLAGDLHADDSADGLEVFVDFSGGGTFFDPPLARRTLTITASEKMRTIDVTVPPNDADDYNANLTAMVSVASGNYFIPSGSMTHTVLITDNDVPELTIAATPTTATEGAANAVFTITASIAPKSDLTVALSVTEAPGSGDDGFVSMANEGAQSLTFTAGNTGATYTVGIVNDGINEADGSVTVMLSANDQSMTGQEYTVSTTTGDDSATVMISDDDIPQISIAVHASSMPTVTEGADAVFTVTASPEPYRDLTINLNVPTAADSTFLDVNPAATLTLSANTGGITYSFATEGDLVDEGDSTGNGQGRITVSIDDTMAVGFYEAAPDPDDSSATVTIEDDDTPELSIERVAASVTEAPAGSPVTSAQFRVISNPAPRANLTVSLEVADLMGSDFIAADRQGSQTLTFPGMAAETIYEVPIAQDGVSEGSGNITVSLNDNTTAQDYTVGAMRGAMVFVVDDDTTTPDLTVADVTVDEGAGTLTFTIAVNNGPIVLDATFDYEVTGGTAVDGTDFTAIGTTEITLPHGSTSAETVVVTIAADDLTDEFDKTFTITLSNPSSNVRFGDDGIATGTIVDNDVPVLAINRVGTGSISEEMDVVFAVNASIAPKSDLEVALDVTDAANPGFVGADDMDDRTVTLVFDSNGGRTATYTLDIDDDRTDEADGNVTVTLARNDPNMTGQDYAVGSPDSVTVAVEDNDTPELSISGGAVVTEGDPGDSTVYAEFTLTASIAPKSDLTVALSVTEAPGSGDDGFVSMANEGSQVLTFTAGNTRATYTVGIVNDGIDEADGSVTVMLSANDQSMTGQEYTVVSAPDNTATVAVMDDDIPQISIAVHASSMPTVTEGADAVFTVTASPEPYRELTINLNVPTAADSTFLDVDPAAMVILPANTGGITYSFATEGDLVDEGDSTGNGQGRITVSIDDTMAVGSYEAGATAPSATVTIEDDDTPELSIRPVSTDPVREMATTTYAEFTVTASGVVPRADLTVNLNVTDVQKTGSDFIPDGMQGSRTLTFPGMATTTTYRVPIAPDEVMESSGDITVTILTNPAQDYGLGAPVSASITVVDNDTNLPDLSISDVTVEEDAGTLTFTVAVNNGPIVLGATVSYEVEQGTGTADDGTDFTAATGTLSFAPNSGSADFKTVEVVILDDATNPVDEFDETFTISISTTDTMNVRISRGVATGTIVDNDTPVLNFTGTDNYSVTEGMANPVFMIEADIAPKSELTVAVSVADAADPGFVAVDNQTITLDFGGGRTATHTFAIDDDNTDEADGSVTVTLPQNDPAATGHDYTVGTPNTRTIAVTDDDVPQISIVEAYPAGMTKFIEGTHAEAAFTVSALPVPYRELTINLNVPAAADSTFLNTDPVNYVTLPANTGSVPYTFAIHDDSEDEGDTTGNGRGRLTVSIDDSMAVGYEAGAVNPSATVTIEDDDTPRLSIMPVSSPVREGMDAHALFTVTSHILPRVAPSGENRLSVNLTVDDVAGSEGNGFVNTDGELNNVPLDFTATGAGTTATATYTVLIDDDTTADSSGALTVSLRANTGADYDLGGTSDSAEVFVADNDGELPVVTVADVTAGEGDGILVWTLAINKAPVLPAVVGYTVADGTADGTDYTVGSATGTFTFEANSTDFKTLTLNITDDTIDEFDETVTITLSTTSPDVDVSSAVATGTIRDNDAPVLRISGGTNLTEGDPGGPAVFTEFTITADRAPKSALEVALEVTDAMNADFVAMDSRTITLDFGGGLTATHTFEIVNDRVDEASGDVTVTLPQNDPDVPGNQDYRVSTTTGDDRATFTVTDNDTPVLSFRGNSFSATENGANPVFTIDADIAPKSALTVVLNVTDVAMNADYVGEHNQTVTLNFDGDSGTSATHTFAIDNDDMNEADGTVTVTLAENSGQDYTVNPSDNSATVAVTDDDIPQISIAEVYRLGVSEFVEGTDAAAVFAVNASPVSYRELEINLNVPAAADSTFLNTDPENSVTLPANTLSVTYTFAIHDDSNDEGDATGNGRGLLTVSIAGGTGYAASSTDPASATVTIEDDDTPRLSITSVSSPVREGMDAHALFTVTSHILPRVAPSGENRILVNLTVDDVAGSEGNGFVNTDGELNNVPLDFTATGAGTTATATYTVLIDDDTTADSSGALTVSLRANTGADYDLGGTSDSAEVFVADNDGELPVVTVADVTAGEGDGILVWTLAITKAPVLPAVVGYTVADGTAEGTDYTIDSAAPGTFTFEANSTDFKTLTLNITDDDMDEFDETVTITLSTTTPLNVTATDTAAGTIRDNDEPVLAINRVGTGSVSENMDVVFAVNASIAPKENLEVVLNVNDVDGGNFVDMDGDRTVTLTFDGGNLTANYTLDITDDSMDEADGTLTVTLDTNSGQDYAVGSPGSATVAVTDNDTPELVISRVGESPITEGANAAFVVNVNNSIAPKSDLMVPVVVSETGAYLAMGEETRTLTFPEMAVTHTFAVEIENDNTDEADGSVTVRLSANDEAVTGLEYTVGATDSATVMISDDDVPQIRISRVGAESITENTDAMFTVSASPVPHEDLTINLTVPSAADSTFLDTAPENSVTLSANTGGVTYAFATEGDLVDEGVTADAAGQGRQTLTVAIAAGTGYAAVSGSDSATVTVTDDDTPILSFRGNNFSVTENGTNPVLTIDADIAPDSALEVALNVTDVPAGADYVNMDGNRTVTLTFDGDGGTSATYTFDINNDNTDEADGNVTVTLAANTGQDYTVNSSDDTATVAVTDDDTPELSISGGAAVTEGDPGDTAVYAVFTLTANIPPKDDLTVALTVADVTDSDFITQEGNRTFTFPGSTLTATYGIQITNDNVAEANGDVRVTLATPPTGGQDYTVSTTDNTATVDVTDNDKTVQFTAAGGATSVEERDGGTMPISLTTNFAAPAGGLTLTGTVTDGTANDIGIISGTIEAGMRTGTLTVAVNDDTDAEDLESFEITLGNPAEPDWSVGDNGTHTVNVEANDNTVGFAVDMSSLSEDGTANLTLRLSNPAYGGGLSVTVTKSDDATGDLSVNGNNGNSVTVLIPAGATTHTISLMARMDDDPEDEIMARLQISAVQTCDSISGNTCANTADTPEWGRADTTGVDSANNDHTVTIPANDKTVEFMADGGATTVDEDGGTATITLTTNFNAPAGDLAVTGTITGGTTNNSDIGTISGTIPAGTQTGTLTVRIPEDAVVEGDESFEITLNDPAQPDWSAGAKSTHTVVIRANDGTVGFTSADGGTVGEGHEFPSFGIRANAPVRENIVFRVRSSHPEDVLLNGASLTAAREITLNNGGGETLFTFSVNPDDIGEPQETVTLSLEAVGGGLPAGWVFSNETFTFNIEANGNEIAFTEGPGAAVTLSEGGTQNLELTLGDPTTGATPEEIVLDVTFSSADARLQGGGTTLTISPSTSGSVNIPVEVVDDTTPEDAETLTVSFSIQGTPPTGWSVDAAADEYAITIPANDKTFEFTESGGATIIEESAGAATLAIETNFAPDGNVAITGTVAGNDGNDIGAISGAIVGGTQTGTLTVEIIDDDLAEVRESFVITLSPVVETSSPATLGWAVGTKNTRAVAVSHSDNTVSIAGDDAGIEEGGGTGTATLTVALSNVSPNPVNVRLTLTDDERFGPESGDLSVTGGTLNFGARTLDVTIPADTPGATLTFSAPDEADLADTGREIITFSIDDVSGAPSGWARSIDNGGVLGDDVSYTLTIIDDDLPSVSLAGDVILDEEGGTMTFTVEIGSAPEGSDVVVNYTIDPGLTNPATAGEDYSVARTGRLTFPAGSEASQTIEAPILPDTLDEFNETILVTISLAAGTGNATLGTSAATGTITDNDTPILSISATPATAIEGSANAVFTISADRAPKGELTALLTVAETALNNGLNPDFVDSGDEITAMPVTLNFDGAAFSVTYTVEIRDDNLDEGATNITASNVTVTLAENSGQDYDVDSLRNAAAVAVSDNDVPQLSICQTADGGGCASAPVLEGDASGSPARFLVYGTSDFDVETEIIVDITGSSNDLLAATLPREERLRIPAGSALRAFGYQTAFDTAPGGGGTVTAALRTGSGYTVAPPPENAAAITVLEDDLPELRISGPATVAETNGIVSMTFTVSLVGDLDASDSGGLGVDVEFSGGGGFLAAPARRTLNITENNGTATTVITFNGNDDDDFDADLTAAMVNVDAGKYLAAASHTVRITDDDTPQLTITATPPAVTEGAADAVFTIAADIAPKSPLAVEIDVSETAAAEGELSRDFISSANEGAGNVTLTFGGGTAATYTVEIAADDLDESDGAVTARMSKVGDGDYTVGSPSAATVSVEDDDPPQMSICQTTDGAACVESPVSVAEGETSGNELVFLITATSAPDSDTAISLNVSIPDKPASVFDNQIITGGAGVGSVSVTMLRGETGATLTYMTVPNTESGGHRTVEATLDPVAQADVKTRGYSVAPSPDDGASIRIMEDDAALITLCEANPAGDDCAGAGAGAGSVRSAVTSMPNEGRTLTFLLKLTYALEEDINVQVDVAETGNVLSGGGVRTIPIRSGEVVSDVFTVETVNDSSDEDSSMVTVTVLGAALADGGSASGIAEIHPTASSVAFMVLDNDEPPLISFTREVYEGNEDDGEVIFAVELLSVSPNSAGREVSSEKEITFAYSTGDDPDAGADGRAMADVDYVSVPSQTFTIPANTRRATFTITTIDDDEEGEDETFLVTLSDPVNALVTPPAGLNLTGVKTAKGRILDTILVDEANRIILPRLAMTIADETATAIGDRIRTAFGGGGSDGVTMRGSDWRQFIASQAAGSGEHAEAPELNLSDFAFAIAADTADRSGGWRDFGGGFLKDLSVWGRGYYRTLEVGEETDIEFDGGITGGMVGVDTMLKPNLLAGVSGNIFQSDLDFSSASPSRTRTGTHETIAWSVHPYIGWNPTPRTTLWGTIGYGMGGIEVREDGRRSDSDTYFRERDIMLMTFGGGGSGELFNRRVGRGRVSVDAVGDMVFARIIEDGEEGLDADGGRVRLGLEMAATRPVWRGNVGGSIEMAYRGDFGDVLRGSGFEVAGGLKIGVPSIGLRIDGEARALVSHTDSVKERGFTGDITWSPGGGAQGPFVSFNPQWGATNDKSDALWNQGADGITADIGGGLRYELEFGYGAPLMYEMGDVKVFAGGLIEEGATVSRSGGLDIEMESGISAGYEAVDEVSAPQVEHRAYIKFIREF